MTPRARIPLLLAASLAVAAIASSCADPVHDQLVTSLGPEDPSIPQGEFHRAGQPCTACHGVEGPAKTQFSLAGTIFWAGGVAQYSGSVVGVNVASVNIVNSAGARSSISTNCVGNFFVRTDQQGFAFPILASVTYSNQGTNFTASMATQISRASSCADCHFDPVNYNTPGHIFLQGGAPPKAELDKNANCPVDPDLGDSTTQTGLP